MNKYNFFLMINFITFIKVLFISDKSVDIVI